MDEEMNNVQEYKTNGELELKTPTRELIKMKYQQLIIRLKSVLKEILVKNLMEGSIQHSVVSQICVYGIGS